MTQTFNQDIFIDGSVDNEQLRVQGNATQTKALTTWEANGAGVLSQVTADGRFQVGDDLGLATPDSLVEAHRSEVSTTKPKRGFHSLGQITGALNSIVSWSVHELVLKGTAGIQALHSAVRVRLRNENTGSNNASAQLRAIDIEATNAGGSSSSSIAELTGVRVGVNTESTGYTNRAYGVKVDFTGTNVQKSYAFHADQGIVRAGNGLEMPNVAAHPSSLSEVQFYALGGKLYAQQGATRYLVSFIPEPLPTDTTKYLKGDGTWATVAGENPMQGATGSVAGQAGLVPQPAVGDNIKYLRGDATWATVANPSVMQGATGSVAGQSGLVPQPVAGDNLKYLRGDGTWHRGALPAQLIHYVVQTTLVSTANSNLFNFGSVDGLDNSYDLWEITYLLNITSSITFTSQLLVNNVFSGTEYLNVIVGGNIDSNLGASAAVTVGLGATSQAGIWANQSVTTIPLLIKQTIYNPSSTSQQMKVIDSTYSQPGGRYAFSRQSVSNYRSANPITSIQLRVNSANVNVIAGSYVNVIGRKYS